MGVSAALAVEGAEAARGGIEGGKLRGARRGEGGPLAEETRMPPAASDLRDGPQEDVLSDGVLPAASGKAAAGDQGGLERVSEPLVMDAAGLCSMFGNLGVGVLGAVGVWEDVWGVW